MWESHLEKHWQEIHKVAIKPSTWTLWVQRRPDTLSQGRHRETDREGVYVGGHMIREGEVAVNLSSLSFVSETSGASFSVVSREHMYVVCMYLYQCRFVCMGYSPPSLFTFIDGGGVSSWAGSVLFSCSLASQLDLWFPSLPHECWDPDGCFSYKALTWVTGCELRAFHVHSKSFPPRAESQTFVLVFSTKWLYPETL